MLLDEEAERRLAAGAHKKKPRKVREKDVEKKGNKWAKAHGWYQRKWTSPGHRGVPDRIYVKNGVVVFFEWKRPGEEPTALQKDEIALLRAHGANAYWGDSVESLKTALLSHDQFGQDEESDPLA